MSQIHHSNLDEPIYSKVKTMILSNKLKPGEKIIQEKLAAELGVSRTPLKSALQKLEFELLVENIPRKGIYVKKMDLYEILEIFDVREGIDAVASRLAASRGNPIIAKELGKLFEPFIGMKENIPADLYRKADEKFHFKLISYSGNKLLGQLFSMHNISRKAFQVGLLRSPEETMKEHLEIIEFIRQNDPNKASIAAAMHIRKSRDLIVELIKEKKNIQL